MKIHLSIILMMTQLGHQQAMDIKNEDNLDSGKYLVASIQLIKALQMGEDTAPYTQLLEAATLVELTQELDSDEKKLAFWLNVYNGYIQLRLNANPSDYEDRREFFKKEQISIAGEKMSFADIEHGIIRRSQFEYFLGYVRNPFVSSYKKKLRPKRTEYRVHFALNCGAKSCPPVRAYTATNLNSELEDSTLKFLNTFTTYDAENNGVLTTPLFSWFRGDFGGKSGTKKILKKYGLIPSVEVELSYDSYDWTLYLDNYVK